MAFKVFLIAALVEVAIARGDTQTAPANYDFEYAVNDPPSGNDFGHREARDGAHTQGSYFVLLPDGRLQRVNYNVQRVNYNVDEDSGFVAEVLYKGEATPAPYTPPPKYA